VDEVLGAGQVALERNLVQSRQGGYDIAGLPWLALEVKRRESGFSVSWWQQTLRQAGEGQEPVLLWRTNNRPWKARILAPVVTDRWMTVPLELDMDVEPFEAWFRQRLQISGLTVDTVPR